MDSFNKAMDPIVLVENEVTVGGLYDHWQDVTGERYQFPNQYRNLICPGRAYVYYRGVRRPGGLRGPAEYFGTGMIGSVNLDPSVDQNARKTDWKWLCEIDDYRPFVNPVPAKQNGVFLEDIAPNRWGVPRKIPNDVFWRILELGGIADVGEGAAGGGLSLPDIESSVPSLVGNLTIPNRFASSAEDGAGPAAGRRRSRYSRLLGQRGEEIVLKYLRSTLPPDEAQTLRWVSSLGETPGWDVEYRSQGKLIAVEVKASGGSGFPAVEMTSNEWKAALNKGPTYRLALVAKVRSVAPEIQFLDDVASLWVSQGLVLEPLLWRVTFR